MTSTFTPAGAGPDPTATSAMVAMADIAAVLDDAARLLGLLEDWLRHTDPLVHDELALFLPPGTGPSRLRAFIDVIGETALNLSRLLPGDTP